MTESARRLEAAHGIGKPHLWPHAGLLACTLGPMTSVHRKPCAALRAFRALVQHEADLARYRWGSW